MSVSLDEPGPVTETNVTEIAPRLFLGDKRVAQDKAYLKDHGLTHIVNVTTEIRNYFEKEPPFKYLQCPVMDSELADLGKYFVATGRFIHEAITTGGSVLVHCKQGVSRSTSVVIAYLMKYQAMNLSQAYQHVKRKREQANPNQNFLVQLVRYGNDHCSSSGGAAASGGKKVEAAAARDEGDASSAPPKASEVGDSSLSKRARDTVAGPALPTPAAASTTKTVPENPAASAKRARVANCSLPPGYVAPPPDSPPAKDTVSANERAPEAQN